MALQALAGAALRLSRTTSAPLGRVTTESVKTIAQVKKLFFDREAVQKAVDAATVRTLNRLGAMVRLTARRSMRRKKGPSAPGQPPHAHGGPKKAGKKFTGAWLKELILYSYDPLTRTVVVGPLKFRRSNVPALHEFGGTADKVEWRTVAGKRVPVKVGVSHYPPRPYMKPALDKILPLFAEKFRGTVGG